MQQTNTSQKRRFLVKLRERGNGRRFLYRRPQTVELVSAHDVRESRTGLERIIFH